MKYRIVMNQNRRAVWTKSLTEKEAEKMSKHLAEQNIEHQIFTESKYQQYLRAQRKGEIPRSSRGYTFKFAKF